MDGNARPYVMTSQLLAALYPRVSRDGQLIRSYVSFLKTCSK